jgi:hypothetical protein
MKIVKKILVVIGCLIAIPLIVALFMPRTYTVSVTETINQPRQKVFDFVKMLDNQKLYSVWVMADPNLNPEVIGTDGTVGAIQRWNSKLDEVGEGEQEITKLSPDRIDVDIRFKRPWEGNAKAANLFKDVDGSSTEVTSEFYSEAPWPMNLPSYIFGRGMIRDAEAKSLKNIKNILETASSTANSTAADAIH